MCYHRLYIYAFCGHSTWAATPLVECEHAAVPPHSTFSTKCELTAHPYQSWKLESLCPKCYQIRSDLLRKLESNKVVYEDWRWKVSYGMPKHGKDFWGRKADERERLERETGKRTKRSMIFPWRRSRRAEQMDEAKPRATSTEPAR